MKNINNDNNLNAGHANNIQRVIKKKNVEQKATSQKEQTQQSSQEYSAILGRSQINFGRVKTDSLSKDIDAFLQNPKGVADANKFFDIALKKNQGREHAYEYTTLMAKEYYDIRYKH